LNPPFHNYRLVNPLVSIAAVAAGGALGSVLRFLVSGWFLTRFGPGFPWGTFAVNISGSFAIGFVVQLATSRADFSPYLRLLLVPGILGGYTTFSAFAYETYGLGTAGFPIQSIAYAAGSVVAGVAAAYAGVAVVRSAHP
jgi:fluoride exporter